MHALYDVGQAKSGLEAIMQERQGDIQSTPQLASMFQKGSDIYEVQRTGHVWRLVYKTEEREDALQEVVVSAQGILTKRDLPPFVDRSRQVHSNVTYVRQGVQITGYGLQEFDSQKDALATVLFMFKRQVGSQVADDLNLSSINGSFCIDASNRLFTPASEPGAGDAQPIPHAMDPTGGMGKAAGSGLLYTEDNDVFYKEKKLDRDRIKYTNVEPQIFQEGDIVEIQMSFLIVPLRNQKSRLNMVLRGITLMDGEYTKNAAVKALAEAKALVGRNGTEKRIRRSVGYMQDQLSATRAKFQKMDIDDVPKPSTGDGEKAN